MKFRGACALLLFIVTFTAGNFAQAQDAAQDKAMTPAQKLMGDTAPKLADLTDRVLFGEVWAGPELSQRDRSLITVSALIALNRPEQLRSHLMRARQNGLTKDEIVGTVTHLAFYSGWPNAVTAVGIVREVFKDDETAAP